MHLKFKSNTFNILILIAFIMLLSLLALSMVGCNKRYQEHPRRTHSHKYAKHKETVYYVHDKYACYDNGFWYYYMMTNMMSNSSSSSTIAKSNNYYSSSSFNSSLPKGGGWVKAPDEEQSEIANQVSAGTVASQELEVTETADGELSTPDQAVEVQMEFDFVNDLDQSAHMSEDTPAESAESSSSDSSSSSADSGSSDAGSSSSNP